MIWVLIIMLAIGFIGAIVVSIKALRQGEESDLKCERCGYIDEEANICGTCKRTICDACMADFIANECLDCSKDYVNDEDE